ncbi:MAG: TIGR02186 family protein [Pseudomonadota bacterium]
MAPAQSLQVLASALMLLTVGTGNAAAAMSFLQEDERLTIALTTDQVDVDAGFSGARLTLFGVINGGDDPAQETADTQIVAILTGPPADVRGRPMIRMGPIWTAANPTRIMDVPGLYYVLSSAPMGIIADDETQYQHGLEPAALTFDVADEGAADSDSTTADRLTREMIQTLVGTRQDQNLFRRQEGAIRRMQNGLFAVEIDLPAQTPVGAYAVQVSAWQNGTMIASDRASLTVRKAGVERVIYDFARNHAFYYGITCVLISLIAGWAVSLVFRRR